MRAVKGSLRESDSFKEPFTALATTRPPPQEERRNPPRARCAGLPLVDGRDTARENVREGNPQGIRVNEGSPHAPWDCSGSEPATLLTFKCLTFGVRVTL